MSKKASRKALADKVRQESRAAVGVPREGDDPTVEIVRADKAAGAETLWDKPQSRSGVGAWIAVVGVFAASLAAAFAVGFAILYAVEVMR